MRIAVFIFILYSVIACNNSNDDKADKKKSSIPDINYATLATYPHDTTSYTEGFLVHNGQLYESTGYDSAFPSTRSLFGIVNLKTGAIDVKTELDKHKYFGEGIVFLHDKVYQLTYKTKIGFIYDEKMFRRIGEFKFPSEEGWGMTTDSSSLIMSDGTSRLTWLDPSDFRVTKTIHVTDEYGQVGDVNELEYINRFIYANVYGKNYLIKIDPATGNIVGKIDLSSIDDEITHRYPGRMQMNGIAFDPVADKIYITGKLWPNIYEIFFSH
jgi:glutamine cyclotransferase